MLLVEMYMPFMYKGVETDYLVSNTGKVFSIKANKHLKLTPNKKGYIRVGIYLPNKKLKRISVHKMVLESFGFFKPGDNYQIDHKDGDKTNNWLNNLEWVTPSENIKRAFNTGLKHAVKGSKHPVSVYTEETIHQACKLLISGKSIPEVSKTLNITKNYLYSIIKGNQWKHIVEQYDLSSINIRIKTTNEIKEDIEYFLNQGYKKSKIISILDDKYGINSKHIVYNFNR